MTHFIEAGADIEKWTKLIDRACQERVVLPMEEKAIDMNRRISLVTKYYLEGDPFAPNTSIDLADAVLRQFGFIEKMDRIGGLDSVSYAKGSEETASPSLTLEDRLPQLAKSIGRYHRWLNVLTVKNDLLCPTLDIDQALHTHQLLPSYYADCFVATGILSIMTTGCQAGDSEQSSIEPLSCGTIFLNSRIVLVAARPTVARHFKIQYAGFRVVWGPCQGRAPTIH